MELTVQQFKTVGLTPTFDAASVGGDTYVNTGSDYVFVKNAGAAAITVTVPARKACDMGFMHDLTFDVAAGDTEQIAPINKGHYNDDTSMVTLNYSDVTSVSVAVVSI